MLPINVPKVQRESSCFVIQKKRSNSSEFYYLESDLYFSNMDIVEGMVTPNQEKHQRSESCITVEVLRRRQKNDFYSANDGSGLAFFITDLGHTFGSSVGNELGVMLMLR